MEKVTDLKAYKENLKKQKEAKAVIPHLEAILKVFVLTIAALKIFKAYIPVAKVLAVIEDQKLILDSHLTKYRKLLKENEK